MNISRPKLRSEKLNDDDDDNNNNKKKKKKKKKKTKKKKKKKKKKKTKKKKKKNLKLFNGQSPDEIHYRYFPVLRMPSTLAHFASVRI